MDKSKTQQKGTPASRSAPTNKAIARPIAVALTAEAWEQAAECLRVLAHPTRLQMIHMLLRDRLTVGELAERCNIASSLASEHLRLMQRCGFLKSHKEARNVFYEVSEPELSNIMGCIESRFGTPVQS